MALPDNLETALRTPGGGSPWAAPAALLLLAAVLWIWAAPGIQDGSPAPSPAGSVALLIAPQPPVAESPAPTTPAPAETPSPASQPHGHEVQLKRLTILLPALSSPSVRYSDEPPAPLPSRAQLEKLFDAYDAKLRQSLVDQWHAPTPSGASVLDVVHVKFSLSSEGTVQRAKITEPSNSLELNGSVEELLQSYSKAPGSLPATLLDDSYDLEAEFRAY